MQGRRPRRPKHHPLTIQTPPPSIQGRSPTRKGDRAAHSALHGSPSRPPGHRTKKFKHKPHGPAAPLSIIRAPQAWIGACGCWCCTTAAAACAAACAWAWAWGGGGMPTMLTMGRSSAPSVAVIQFGAQSGGSVRSPAALIDSIASICPPHNKNDRNPGETQPEAHLHSKCSSSEKGGILDTPSWLFKCLV
jgi:hypothetical protein